MKVKVKTLENKEAGELALDKVVFGAEINQGLIYDMIKYQLAARRAGTHKVKTRSEVKATGKKPFRQKGTGNARRGTMVAPIHVGGGVAHGPTPRSHAIAMPKKKRALALVSALSSKAKDGKLIILDDVKSKTHKTKPMAEALGKLGVTESSALIVGGKELDANFSRATANLPRLDVLPSQGANVYDIMRRDVLVLTKDAVSDLTERLKG